MGLRRPSFLEMAIQVPLAVLAALSIRDLANGTQPLFSAINAATMVAAVLAPLFVCSRRAGLALIATILLLGQFALLFYGRSLLG